MKFLEKIFIISFITVIFITIAAGEAYTQTDEEVVSFFVKDQLEVKENQTIFNVFRIENKTGREIKIQVNFTLPIDWEFYGDRTHFVTLGAHKDISLPIRISPSPNAKGGVGYALNATLLSMAGDIFASKYCFLTVPVRTKIDTRFSAMSYYLDHRYGRSQMALNIKNDGNSHRMMGIKLFCDDRILFSETGQSEINTELSLDAGKDTTIHSSFRFDDMIENIRYFNRSLTAEITTSDTTIKKYAFVKYLDYKYEHYIDDADQPLVLEATALDVLSDYITFRFFAYGKLKFKQHRSLSYYYRSMSGPIKNFPNLDYDEYSIKYSTQKQSIEAGNLRDNEELSLFGHGIKYNNNINSKTYIALSAIDDIFSNNLAMTGKAGVRIRKADINALYTKMISDTSGKSYMDMYGLGIRIPYTSWGNISIYTRYNQYSNKELNSKNGYNINVDYSNRFGKVYLYTGYKTASPYSATYNHGREEINASLNFILNRRNNIQANYTKYKYRPASIYNNMSEDANYQFHNARVLYNYMLGKNSVIYMGPNYDYGTSNYINTGEIVDKLKLSSAKVEIGYRYSPNLFAFQNLNLNMQLGQMNPLSWYKALPSDYTNKSNVLKFTATLQGKRWGVYGMYYSGLYNMNIALTNFYTGTAGKYLYFMPYFRITSANKMFYYEIRFSYLNNIDLKNTRTSIMQEAGADFGGGWSARLQNNTNIQALQDATGQSYRYTNNYMEITLRKVFKWNQPGQKYHTLTTVFYRDIDGNRVKGDNEPGVENVVMGITNNASLDTSYHYTGEMFGNMDVASNYNGVTIYKNIPEAQYFVNYNPTDEQNERFNIEETGKLINLDRDMTIYVPFVERNLVFGTIKFNRAKRSAVQEINLDGIKVSITDSHGQAWYGFTDQNGYYEIYAPVADFYTVQIASNLWSDHFDLRQDKYIIKFNGYKRFEVNFEFDEKTREIKFDDVIDIDDIVSGENFKFEDVAQIKQTILRGTVSDENTLQPLQATIEVIDLSRHDVIAKMKSSTTNGSFFTTFITGRNYQLRISAPGYWIHQELLADNQLTTFETINRDGLLLKKIAVGKAMDLHNLLFAENSSDLTPEAKAELETVVILLANNENVKINVQGFCANTENDPNTLSSQRARKVIEFLTFRGISVNRITMEGRGAVSSNKDVAQFRKVEIVVTSNK